MYIYTYIRIIYVLSCFFSKFTTTECNNVTRTHLVLGWIYMYVVGCGWMYTVHVEYIPKFCAIVGVRTSTLYVHKNLSRCHSWRQLWLIRMLLKVALGVSSIAQSHQWWVQHSIAGKVVKLTPKYKINELTIYVESGTVYTSKVLTCHLYVYIFSKSVSLHA